MANPWLETSRVRIFDTTLRDGEQSPGATLTSDEKLILAQQIAELGVDVMEAGFPAASPDDLQAVRRIARTVGRPGGPIITGLARACRQDIDLAAEAVRDASRPRIHTFLATSDLHMEHKLQMSRRQVLERVEEMVAYAASLCADVEFSPEDAGRSEPDFLVEVLTVAIQAGANTLNIPDTVGYTLPQEYGGLIAKLIADTPGSEEVIWSVHCHDDLGLATANALAGLEAGARQAEVTINGIGERAGNTSLEELVMALETRRPELGLETGIDTRRLAPTSRLVSRYTGMPVAPNKAIVGANAFSHEAGIHQDGMLKHAGTYEIMTPESVGVSSSHLHLGKHSGRHALRARLQDLGFHLGEGRMGQIFAAFKNLAERRKEITDADLRALVQEETDAPTELWRFEDVRLAYGQRGIASATVRLVGPDGQSVSAAESGTGSMDAIFRAIQKITGAGGRLLDFNIRNVTAGIDALGEVTVRLAERRGHGRDFTGYATDTDIVLAGTKAYLSAVNRLLESRGLPAPRAAAFAAAETPEAPEEAYDPHYTVGIP